MLWRAMCSRPHHDTVERLAVGGERGGGRVDQRREPAGQKRLAHSLLSGSSIRSIISSTQSRGILSTKTQSRLRALRGATTNVSV
jgi:hypothetical protein